MKTLNKAFFKNRAVVELKEQLFEILQLDIVQSIHAESNPNIYKYRIKDRRTTTGRKFRPLGAVFADYYRKLKPEKREIMARKIEAQFDDAKLATFRSRIDSFNLKSDKSILDQIIPAQFLSKIKIAEFPWNTLMLSSEAGATVSTGGQTAIATVSSGSPTATATVSGGSGQATAVVRKKIKEIDFILNEVESIKETGAAWLGKDEIAMGGNAIDDKGNTTKISEFEVGQFDTGDIKKYSNGKYLKKFYPDSEYTEDKLFLVQLFLIEKDSEGASEFLIEAYEAAKSEIGILITEFGAAALAAAITAAAPTMGASLAVAIAAVAAALAVAVLAELVRWLAEILEDDIFTPSDDHLTAIIVESSTDTFEDGSKEKTKYMTFEDHGGKYRIKYTWKLVKS